MKFILASAAALLMCGCKSEDANLVYAHAHGCKWDRRMEPMLGVIDGEKRVLTPPTDVYSCPDGVDVFVEWPNK